MNSIIDLEKEGLGEKLTGRLIGQGSFGIVTKCVWRGKNVAIKRFLGEQKSFLAELNNLIKVEHENIIQCFAFKQSENMIIMEYAEDGSLHQLLHSPRYSNVTYNLAHALNWALQTAKGVHYLHSIKPKLIIHRDLKPLNILLKSNFSVIKICDFGTACPNKTIMTQTQGSIAWMAPEVMKGSKYNEKCDIFSWAIIFWELLSRKIPHSNSTEKSIDEKSDESSANKSTNCTTYPNYSPWAILWSIASGIRPKLLKNCPKVFQELIEACWSDTPELRPSMDEIVTKMELYFSIVKDEIYPIDSSKIIPEESQNNLSFNPDDIKINNPNSVFQNYTFTVKKCLPNIPDNVELEPLSETVTTTKNRANEASVIKHCINFAPITEDNKALEVLNLKKQDDKENLKFISAIELNNIECENGYYDDEYDISGGCGIGSISKIVTDMITIKPKSQSTFYLEETTDCSQISELDSKFTTLTPNDNLKDNSNEYTQHIITKHKKHRSEIEINNCKQLNSSASSTISSSTSIVIDKKVNDKTTFRSNGEVDKFFDSTNSSSTTNENDETLEGSDDYKLGSSCSSFESIDKEEIKEQIERELKPGQQIKYNIKSKRGINIKNLRKVFRSKNDLRLPSDI